MPALIIRTGPQAGSRIEIDGELVIGRGEADWVIADPELSRRHLAARAGPAGVEVEDLGSLNGTWLQGRRLDGPTMVADGGVIRLGETEIVIELGAAPATVVPSGVAVPSRAAVPSGVAVPSGAAVPSVGAVRSGVAVAPGAFVAAPGRGRRRVANRMIVPALLAFLAIFATAIALIVYFATR